MRAIRRLPISRVIVAHRRSTPDMADRVVPLWPALIAAKHTAQKKHRCTADSIDIEAGTIMQWNAAGRLSD